MRIDNFGKNVCFVPEHFYVPDSEAEILELMARHRGEKIRTVGRLHAWSEAAASQSVVFDLRNIDDVRVELRNGEPWAIIAAGAQIKHVVAELENKHGLTLPSLGLITEQTIAGAAATGTHGSGRHSLSHYIDEVRIAIYDPTTGEPVVRCIHAGDQLRAARCSLGCLGVVLSVGIRCRPQYMLQQHFSLVNQLSLVFEAEDDFPQQQFFLLPHRWDFLIQKRRESSQPCGWSARMHRLYWYLTVDVALHVVLIGLRRWLRSDSLIYAFFKYLVPVTVIRGWKVVDKSQNLLTMEHELFRHIEVEIFVLRQQLPAAIEFVQQLLRFLTGDQSALRDSTWNDLANHELEETVRNGARYFHHYPICVRKVLADDTLISMASSPHEPYYAISFISYDRPSERSSFFAFAKLLVQTTAKLFDARPHWGKYCPIDAATSERLYPQLNRYRQVCEQLDPDHVFRNDWAESVIWQKTW